MRVKIRGVTDSKQCISIVALDATVLGFNCMSTSARYIKPIQIKTIVDRLPSEIDKIGQPQLPWFLAGGLNPNNILDALSKLNPDGIHLSSGVERSPGDKV
jgi:phosphoribosylanthranilate isomerase